MIDENLQCLDEVSDSPVRTFRSRGLLLDAVFLVALASPDLRSHCYNVLDRCSRTIDQGEGCLRPLRAEQELLDWVDWERNF